MLTVFLSGMLVKKRGDVKRDKSISFIEWIARNIIDMRYSVKTVFYTKFISC